MSSPGCLPDGPTHVSTIEKNYPTSSQCLQGKDAVFDVYGNNAAVLCPSRKKTFVFSGFLKRKKRQAYSKLLTLNGRQGWIRNRNPRLKRSNREQFTALPPFPVIYFQPMFCNEGYRDTKSGRTKCVNPVSADLVRSWGPEGIGRHMKWSANAAERAVSGGGRRRYGISSSNHS